MDDLSQFPKYQWSYFVGSNRNEQYVIRSSDIDDFNTRIAEIKEMVKDQVDASWVQEPIKSGAVAPTQIPLQGMCPIHSVAMTTGKKGTPYHKDAQGRFCFGKKTETAPDGWVTFAR